MKPIIINKPEFIEKEGCPAVTALLEIGENRYELWYSAVECPVSDEAGTFLSAALTPAMRAGMPLHMMAPVSPRLLGNINEIQNIFHIWDRRFQKIILKADAGETFEYPQSRGVGCFFTGGVDSFYTFLKHSGEVTHLVFVHGFEKRLMNDLPLRKKVSETLRGVAGEFGKSFIEVETNLRSFSDKYVSWELYHGSALAAVAHLLSSRIKKVYIPSSSTYSILLPWGSHPLLDPLWSAENIEIVHDGCELFRVEKTAEIVSCHTALKTLRVCYEGGQGDYNCGQCEKCLRTMVHLRIAGALDCCTTFCRKLDLAALERIRLNDKKLPFFLKTLEMAEKKSNDPELVKALQDCLSQKYHRGIRKLSRRILGRLGIVECQ